MVCGNVNLINIQLEIYFSFGIGNKLYFKKKKKEYFYLQEKAIALALLPGVIYNCDNLFETWNYAHYQIIGLMKPAIPQNPEGKLCHAWEFDFLLSLFKVSIFNQVSLL